MKEKELRDCAKCAMCGRLIGDSGLPMFWRVHIERHGVKMEVVQRQTGLALLLGNAALAYAMGPDEDMTVPLMDPVTLTVCETCGAKNTCIAQLALDTN